MPLPASSGKMKKKKRSALLALLEAGNLCSWTKPVDGSRARLCKMFVPKENVYNKSNMCVLPQ